MAFTSCLHLDLNGHNTDMIFKKCLHNMMGTKDNDMSCVGNCIGIYY